jgi:hypothetical protein
MQKSYPRVPVLGRTKSTIPPGLFWFFFWSQKMNRHQEYKREENFRMTILVTGGAGFTP